MITSFILFIVGLAKRSGAKTDDERKTSTGFIVGSVVPGSIAAIYFIFGPSLK